MKNVLLLPIVSVGFFVVLLTTTTTTNIIVVDSFSLQPSSSSSASRSHSSSRRNIWLSASSSDNNIGSSSSSFDAPLSDFNAKNKKNNEDKPNDTDVETTTSVQGNENNLDSFSALFQQSLYARQEAQRYRQTAIFQKWLKPHSAQSTVAVVLPDWVRRIDVHSYPLVACGTSSGRLFLANLETGKLLAETTTVSNEQDYNNYDEEEEEGNKDDEQLQSVLRLLYGSYDGGGTLAVAFGRTLLVDARRSGGVYVHRVIQTVSDSSSSIRLVSQGSIPALQNTLVTSLQLVKQPQRQIMKTTASSTTTTNEGQSASSPPAAGNQFYDHDSSSSSSSSNCCEYLWVGTADGRLQAYRVKENEDSLPLVMQTQPALQWKLDATVITFEVSHELNCAVVATATGAVHLIDLDILEELEDDDDDDWEEKQEKSQREAPQLSHYTFYPPYDSSASTTGGKRGSFPYSRSVTIVSQLGQRTTRTTRTTTKGASSTASDTTKTLKNPQQQQHQTSSAAASQRARQTVAQPNSYSIVCGGSDGSLFVQPLRLSAASRIDFHNTVGPFQRPSPNTKGYLRPFHKGRVVCLTSPAPGLLVSGGVDGTMRVWSLDAAQCLYQYVGYKVWLGSVWTDGRRLVSDGADNTLIVHDYGEIVVPATTTTTTTAATTTTTTTPQTPTLNKEANYNENKKKNNNNNNIIDDDPEAFQ